MAVTGKGRSAKPLLAALVVGVSLPAGLCAGEPVVRGLDVRGLQIGATTTLVIDGDDLGKAPRLLLPFAAGQTLKAGSNAKKATFDVALAATTTPGFYNLRVVSEGGVSLPVGIAVDRLPQRLVAAKVERLPVALHGVLGGSTVVTVPFTGKAGEKLTVEVEAQRLGSLLRPVVHLYDAKRRQLAWSWNKPALGGDARLRATLPADGAYTVTVHDVEYASPFPGFFRLKVGQWSSVDQVFPPVVGKEGKSVELLGPTAAVRVDLPAARAGSLLPLAWPGEGIWSGPRPFVRVSPHAEVVARGDGKVQELPAGLVGVCGKLREPYAEDRFRVPVKPGGKVQLEAFADRLGSPLQVALVVRDDKGGQLARVEESPTSLDPVLDYVVPAKVTSIVVGVEDAQGRGGPRGVYRLIVTPTGLPIEKPDFRLFTRAQRLSLPVGGRRVFPVLIDRRGYRGVVELSAEGLPAGVKVEGNKIAAGTNGTLVTLVRGTGPMEPVLTNWRGRGDDKRERPVRVLEGPMERLQPWLASELAVAPTVEKAADFQVDWRLVPADVGLVLAGKRVLPVKLVRPKGNDVVRLTLVSSQGAALVNGQPDPNRALRQEKPVEVAAKLTEGDLTVLIPAELDSPSYDLAVQADLLGPDRRTVLATAFTPVRRLAVRRPLVVGVDGPTRIVVKSGKAGTRFEIKGKVERREGLAGDVTVSLTGLPPGGQAAPVTVKAGATAFVILVVLPANFAPGEVKGVKLVGGTAADPKRPGVIIRSREVDLTLAVQAAGK